MKKYFLLILFVLFSTAILCQTIKHQVRGFVFDKKSLERIPAVVIYYNNILLATSDSEGYFEFTTSCRNLRISFKALGFKEEVLQASLEEDEEYEFLIYLQPAPIELETVTVSGEKYTEKYSNSYELLNGDIRNIPVFLESDAIRALHALPGISSTNDFNSQIFMRGGNYDETSISLDGIPLYNAYHFGGFFGAVNPDIIKKQKVYPSNYPVHYDDFISGIVDMETKTGNLERLKTIASLGLVSSKLFVEGPLMGGSFIASGRRTYFDIVNKWCNNPVKFPYYFYDFYAKYSLPVGDKQIISLSGFYSKDQYDAYYNRQSIDETEILNWKILAGKLNYSYLINNYADLSLSVSYSGTFQGADQEAFGYYTTESTNKIFLDNSFSHTAANVELNIKGTGWTSKSGVKINKYRSDYFWDIKDKYFNVSVKNNLEDILFDYAPEYYNAEDQSSTIKLYSVNTINFSKRLKSVLAVAATYLPEQQIYFISPFVKLDYLLTSNIELKFSFGQYFQPVYTKHDRVNLSLFSPFATYFIGKTKEEIPQSDHYSLGMAVNNLPGDIKFELETYYKSRYNIPTAIDYEKEVKFYDGYAYGLDILLKRSSGIVNGWLAYSYSRSVKSNGEYNFFAGYNRTNNIKILLNFDISNTWSFSSFWTYTTGLPFTPQGGLYQTLESQTEDDRYYKLGFSRTRKWLPVYGRKNSACSESSHRLDLGITGRFIWWNKLVVKPYLQVMNVYNSINPYKYAPSTIATNSEGSDNESNILPTIGIILEY